MTLYVDQITDGVEEQLSFRKHADRDEWLRSHPDAVVIEARCARSTRTASRRSASVFAACAVQNR